MKLIVGLGNPGKEYENTRHNIGFMFLDNILNTEFKLNNKFNALEYESSINGERVLFVKPLSYMNLSGEVVSKYVKFYKIDSSDLLIVQDDLDMSVGKYKIMYNHGDGGHNGIKNIIENLSTKEFYRVKIGISKSKVDDTKNYVLGKFNNQELEFINDSFMSLENVVNDFVCLNKDEFIQKYNSRN